MKAASALTWTMLLLATAGFFVAVYLTVEHYLGQVPACSFLSGCEVVTTSEYATIGPFPISLLGAGYFLTVWASLLALLQTGRSVFLTIVGIFTAMGALVAAGLLYLQVFVLEAVCIYCVTSDSISLLLFIFFLLRWMRERRV